VNVCAAAHPTEECLPMLSSPKSVLRQTLRTLLITAITVVLLACDGHSGSEGDIHSLGGTVGGLLLGEGVTLVDGEGDSLAVSANGTFTFPRGFASNDSYKVSVTSQPFGEVCSIVDGSGTFGNSDVMTVVVNCSFAASTVGGTVAGLTSAGLILANGTQSLSIASGATTFLLPQPLPEGASYSIIVATQPPGEGCTIAGGSGKVGLANIANVVVTCSDKTYALGGTVSGLTTAGLVLANGADTLTVPVGATSFTLPTPVSFTSSYDVTVKTQPTGLACFVSQGSGTVPAANVTSVSVSCTDQPFTVGGTVTNSPGITLANGTDALPVPSASGSVAFTMPQKVAAGGTYDVTVESVPAGQTCTVSNGSGVVGAANVSNVAVSCAASSYTVGGSLHGLSPGDVLVLGNSNGDKTTVDPSQSSYTMTIPVALGGSYSLTILTAPTGKTCAIIHSSGSDIAANVTDADVTCAAVTHTIGGTISGLTGATGLELQDNGGDTTSINANATTFTMVSALPEGSPYTVTILAQPTAASVAHATTAINCVVAGGSGTVGAADVTTVAIQCSNTITFSSAGGPYAWAVPPGINSVTIVATGGGGGGGGGGGAYYVGAVGGSGGVVTATLPVSSGTSLVLGVGGGGGGGAFCELDFGGGGGGGGSSSVNAGSANQIIAGGGGGGSSFWPSGTGGNGNGGAGGDTIAGGSGHDGGQGGNGGIGGANGSQSGYAASGNGGPGAAGGTNDTATVIGGPAGISIGTASGGTAGNMGGGGGGGYGGGGGGVTGGGGGGGSTGPSGSTLGVAPNTGAGSPGSDALGANGTPGTDGSIVISY
jgi:hypothetical protein